MSFVLSLALVTGLFAADPAAAARAWRQANEPAIIREYFQLLAIPNVARDRANMARNAAQIQAMLRLRGIESELLEANGSVPAIFAEIRTPGAERTIVFYAHYDGQPVDAAKWTGSGPFEPVLRDKPLDIGGKIIAPPASTFDPESRIYARSASDDKAPILALLTALDAFRHSGIRPRANIKFFFDGEEEAGSPGLRSILARHAAKLGGDLWIFCDGPVHQSRRQQIVFGVRGSTGLRMTIYGPALELHSGHYGNWAPNPAMMLSRLLAGMRDEDGRILIDGFYDDVEPLSETEKRILRDLPSVDDTLRREFQLARVEGSGARLEELILRPALNLQGLQAAGVGAESRNVIPAVATASIGLRLVKGMDHRRAIDKVISHIRKQGYHIVESEPDAATRLAYPKICRVDRSAGGYNAVRVPMDAPSARDVIRAVRQARGDVVLMPTLGGSLPISPIAEVLQVPVIIVPIANHDNNQHGHNENIRIQNLWDGIETMAALLAM